MSNTTIATSCILTFIVGFCFMMSMFKDEELRVPKKVWYLIGFGALLLDFISYMFI